ncbi:MAG: RNA polymerase sigma factor [Pseudomonadota bacterium]
MTDEELINLCREGDGAAFETLLGRYYDTIYRIAYRWCQNQENAQDITQVVCMKLVKSIRQYRAQSSFTSWLYTVVINCAKDFYKSPSQHNTREEQQDELETHAGSNGDVAPRQLYAQQILEHIEQLPAELSETLVLVFATGLNHQHAAQRLNIKESTVSWRIHEARKRLKQTFESSELGAKDAVQKAGGLA